MGGVGGWAPGSGFYLPLGHRQQYYIVSNRRVPSISWGKGKFDPHENVLPIVNAVIQGRSIIILTFLVTDTIHRIG